MKKLLLILFSFLFGLTVAGLVGVNVKAAPVVPTQAQVNQEGMQQAKAWSCLKAELCGGATDPCAGTTASGQPYVAGHRAKLSFSAESGQKPAPGKDRYIVVCIMTKEGNKCTTGNALADAKLGLNELPYLVANYGYALQDFAVVGPDNKTTNLLNLSVEAATKPTGTTNPNQSNGPYEWQDYTSQGLTREWFAVSFYDPQQQKCDTVGGQQQCTFTFEGLAGKCTGIAWDPYGRVFDSRSLEPVSGASLDIYLKRANNTYTPLTAFDKEAQGGVANPSVPTLADGRYSFLVGAGIYKLDLVVNPRFSFVTNPALNLSYKKMYSDIYQKGAEIDERFGAQHRDIPVVSSGQPITSPVVIMEQGEQLDKANGIMMFSLRFSHPFTQVTIYAKKVDPVNPTVATRTKTLFTGKADKNGWLKTDISQAKLDLGESFEVTYVKTNLTGGVTSKKGLQDFLTGEVNAQETAVQASSVTVDPIPNYAEGYAKDPSDNVMPGATVGVYLTNSTVPYYQTKADANGYFKITSEYLPFYPYKLKYSTANGTSVSVLASKFVAQNEAFITEQKINTNEYVTVNGEKPNLVAQNNNQDGASTNQTSGIGAVQQQNQNQSSVGLILLIVLLLLVGVVGLILGVYLLRRNQQPPVV